MVLSALSKTTTASAMEKFLSLPKFSKRPEYGAGFLPSLWNASSPRIWSTSSVAKNIQSNTMGALFFHKKTDWLTPWARSRRGYKTHCSRPMEHFFRQNSRWTGTWYCSSSANAENFGRKRSWYGSPGLQKRRRSHTMEGSFCWNISAARHITNTCPALFASMKTVTASTCSSSATRETITLPATCVSVSACSLKFRQRRTLEHVFRPKTQSFIHIYRLL